ncbi:MAG: amidohydrolase family protein [Aliifodinibius sp.]|nr:amidohydrolase family protein [candidate division Zixibacteria bacterium]NIT55276.1 amidohydrolase family protein [Fodinibius sp.]NIS46947.1 amidohydrolase family protein [candidate division Zixibacteria bacterium]NIU15094.1 amidohydrolase family protein [candidate division Zixibacteria bacterium]NIV07140.1 amidohydrolase family protein [candidate division Zixibacteria bacterium]
MKLLLGKQLSFASLYLIFIFPPFLLPAQESPETLLLKNYRPQSIYKIPVSHITRAKYPAIDIHSHPYAGTSEEIDRWVQTMDRAGIEKTIILTKATGVRFDSIYNQYARYPDRFEVWCGFDYTGYDQPGFGPAAVAELERCYNTGARGVGELGDKGKGLTYCEPPAIGMHPDDQRMDPLFDTCAELNMPVNIHVAEPIWMYQQMDSTNDGLMNAYTWRLDNQPDIVDHPGMIEILENTVKRHPNTTFIACHFANCSYDLNRLGKLLAKYPNLYADISARYAETSPIPGFVSRFFETYQDRLLYGTDMGIDKDMYEITFRILESNDEHFYEIEQFNYHWALHGFGIRDEILKKIYRGNALKILNKR